MRNVSTRNLCPLLQPSGRFQPATCRMRSDEAIAGPRALSRKSRTAPSERRTTNWQLPSTRSEGSSGTGRKLRAGKPLSASSARVHFPLMDGNRCATGNLVLRSIRESLNLLLAVDSLLLYHCAIPSFQRAKVDRVYRYSPAAQAGGTVFLEAISGYFRIRGTHERFAHHSSLVDRRAKVVSNSVASTRYIFAL